MKSITWVGATLALLGLSDWQSLYLLGDLKIQRAALLLEEPLASEAQVQLNSVTNLIECATGGHGRCANSACECRCHKSRVRMRAKQRMSI
jgi:hypothetical protein